MKALIRTIRGDRSLGQTYWMWFALPNVVVYLADRMAAGWFESGRVASGTVVFTLVMIVLAQLVVVYVMGFGVIRAAINRKPSVGFLGGLAILIVVGAMLRTPATYYDLFRPWYAPVASTSQDVALSAEDHQTILQFLRGDLPREVDAITTLEQMDIVGTTLVYRYLVDDMGELKPNIENLKALRRGQFCDLLDSTREPDVIESLRFEYTLRSGGQKSISVAASDCP